MLTNLFTFIGIMSLFVILGASIYISFFKHKNDSQPIYYRKKKLLMWLKEMVRRGRSSVKAGKENISL